MLNAARKTYSVDWTNVAFFAAIHAGAVWAVVDSIANGRPASTWILGIGWYLACGLAITGGYHRLFAHRAFETVLPIRLAALFFGAAALQNSALQWTANHRLHHGRSDTEQDPYSVNDGFWWAHMGWVLHRGPDAERRGIPDLQRDPWMRMQDRLYFPLAVLAGFVIPALIGALWGDALGGLLVAGFLRVTLQWHATFAVNSLTHWVGRRPYDSRSTARDSFLVALVTFGEGNHNFHHRFPRDFRNGVRWFDFDPTKWLVTLGSKVGLTSGLRRTSAGEIEAARLTESSSGPGDWNNAA